MQPSFHSEAAMAHEAVTLKVTVVCESSVNFGWQMMVGMAPAIHPAWLFGLQLRTATPKKIPSDLTNLIFIGTHRNSLD
jgi:hypothetical protein